MKLIMLGNCATLTAIHSTTSFAIENDGRYLLVDCGPSVVSQLMKAKIPLDKISHIIITHCHGDHSGGYPYLVFSINLARMMSKNNSIEKIEVVAMKSVYDGISCSLHSQYPIEHLEEQLINSHIIPDGEEAIIDAIGLSINLFPTYHIVPSVGMTIRSAGKSICYTCDSLYDERLIHYAIDCNVLIHEAFCCEKSADIAKHSGHATAKEAGIFANKANAGKLILCHSLAFELQNPQNLISEASEAYKGTILIPTELDTFEI